MGLESCLIRKANKNDIDRVMEFIRNYWNKEHILYKSRDFMVWQHYYENEFCFVIAENNITKEIEGIVGYIPCSKGKSRDAFGALWKVRNNKFPGLGLKLKMFMKRNLGIRNLIAIGLNPNTFELHKRTGDFIGTLKHYYMLGNYDEFKVAKINYMPDNRFNDGVVQYQIREIVDQVIIQNNYDLVDELERIPRKSKDFFVHRYMRHPVYKYKFLCIYNHNNVVGIIVARKIECNGRKILRIIDYFGSLEGFEHIGESLQDLVNGEYEYVDCYEYGVPDEFMINAGFAIRNKDDRNIIPNYFEPYVCKNVSLYFFAPTTHGLILFKGDGDQDRPNYFRDKE